MPWRPIRKHFYVHFLFESFARVSNPCSANPGGLKDGDIWSNSPHKCGRHFAPQADSLDPASSQVYETLPAVWRFAFDFRNLRYFDHLFDEEDMVHDTCRFLNFLM